MIKKSDLNDIIDSFNLPANVDFPDDKLAYLALTSKVELRLRDAIAYQIHQKLPINEFVCREWNLIDAAVVDKLNNPQLLIECKSHNSIDFHGFLVNKGKGSPMAKDILKLKVKAQDNTDLYFIFFNNVTKTQTLLPPDPTNKEIFKYPNLLNKLIHLPYKDKVLIVFKNWVKLLGMLKLPLDLTTAVEIYAGNYRGIEASVIAFIYGPFKKDDVNTVSGETFGGFDLDGIKTKIDSSDEINDFIYHDETLKDILSDLKREIQTPQKAQDMNRKANKIHPASAIIKSTKSKSGETTKIIPNFSDDNKDLVVGDTIKFWKRRPRSEEEGIIEMFKKHYKSGGIAKNGNEEVAFVRIVKTNKIYHILSNEFISVIAKANKSNDL